MLELIYKHFLGCRFGCSHSYSFPGASGKSNVVDYFPRKIGNYRICRNLPSEKNCRAKNAGFLSILCLCIFEEVNFICTPKCSILNEKNGCSSMISRANVLCFYNLCLLFRMIAFVLFMQLSISSKTHR